MFTSPSQASLARHALPSKPDRASRWHPSFSTAGSTRFWKALDEVFPGTRHQRCWLHKTGNTLNKVPKSVQPAVKQDLREIWMAPDLKTAERALDVVFRGRRVLEQGP
jgi:hypothetical protein